MGVQCYELFGGIALKNHAFSFFFSFSSIVKGETSGGCFLKSVSNCSVFVTLRSKKLSLHNVVNFSTSAMPFYLLF